MWTGLVTLVIILFQLLALLIIWTVVIIKAVFVKPVAFSDTVLLFGKFESFTYCVICDEPFLLQKLWPGNKDCWPSCGNTRQSFGTTASTEFRGAEGVCDPNVAGPRPLCALWPSAHVQGSSASQGCTYPGTVCCQALMLQNGLFFGVILQ